MFVDNLTSLNSSVYLGQEEWINAPFALKNELPQLSVEKIQSLVNINRGTNEGRMETLGLVKTVTVAETFEIQGMKINRSADLYALDLEEKAANPSAFIQPDHLQFTAEWSGTVLTSGEGNNILGDNGGLFCDESILKIPKVTATSETLAYYGALLIPQDTAVRFPSREPYPLWRMRVGTSYVSDYIMNEQGGGGFYLEYHHDQPHFHMVLDGGGYYLLAKEFSKNTFHITAFEIPNGQAVYTKKGAIHCDAALTGEMIVGYTVSEDCSTVLLRDKTTKSMVQVETVDLAASSF